MSPEQKISQDRCADNLEFTMVSKQKDPAFQNRLPTGLDEAGFREKTAECFVVLAELIVWRFFRWVLLQQSNNRYAGVDHINS